MYEHHFALTYRPFPPAAAASCYVPVGSIEEARQAIARSIQRASGPAVVIGGAGTGKTMLCEVLAEQFSQQFCVVHLNNGRLPTPRALLQAILFELQRPYRNLDENELRLSLADFLASDEACPEGLLLIIDEAHTLPIRNFEEIRLLTNNASQGQSRVRLVLAGASPLEERLTNPKLESFHQRIAARAYLENLSREETYSFIREQIASVGGSPETIFPADAQKAVFDATDGIPRLVNQLCDHALIVASVNEQRGVNAATVQEAWADLQQLPTPWLEPVQKPGKASSAEVIEFGSLRDEEDQGPASIPFPQRSEPAASQRATAELLETAGYRGFVSDEQLDEIERQVAAAQSIDGFGDPDHVVAWTPAEATTHPFAESFDEEEVIVDDYATMEENYLAAAKRVMSEEGREIGSLLAGKTLSPASATVATPNVKPAAHPSPAAAAHHGHDSFGRQEQQALTEAVVALLKQAGAVGLTAPQHDKHSPKPQQSEAATGKPTNLDPDADDRDVIIVQEADEELPNSRPPAKAKRQQYRQLFARLRQA